MSDFLASLVSRSLGLAQTIQPRPLSRYEAEPGYGWSLQPPDTVVGEPAPEPLLPTADSEQLPAERGAPAVFLPSVPPPAPGQPDMPSISAPAPFPQVVSPSPGTGAPGFDLEGDRPPRLTTLQARLAPADQLHAGLRATSPIVHASDEPMDVPGPLPSARPERQADPADVPSGNAPARDSQMPSAAPPSGSRPTRPATPQQSAPGPRATSPTRGVSEAIAPTEQLKPLARLVTAPPADPVRVTAERAAPAVVQPGIPMRPATAMLITRPQEAPPAALSSEQNRPAAQQQAPVIRVNIGRIEVRAVTPAPPAPHPASLRPGPTLSLDDYLKQRDGG